MWRILSVTIKDDTWLFTGLMLKLHLIMKNTKKLRTEVEMPWNKQRKCPVFLPRAPAKWPCCLSWMSRYPGSQSSKFNLQLESTLRVLRKRGIVTEMFRADCRTVQHFPFDWSILASISILLFLCFSAYLRAVPGSCWHRAALELALIWAI